MWKDSSVPKSDIHCTWSGTADCRLRRGISHNSLGQTNIEVYCYHQLFRHLCMWGDYKSGHNYLCILFYMENSRKWWEWWVLYQIRMSSQRACVQFIGHLPGRFGLYILFNVPMSTSPTGASRALDEPTAKNNPSMPVGARLAVWWCALNVTECEIVIHQIYQ